MADFGHKAVIRWWDDSRGRRDYAEIGGTAVRGFAAAQFGASCRTSLGWLAVLPVLFQFSLLFHAKNHTHILQESGGGNYLSWYHKRGTGVGSIGKWLGAYEEPNVLISCLVEGWEHSDTWFRVDLYALFRYFQNAEPTYFGRYSDLSLKPQRSLTSYLRPSPECYIILNYKCNNPPYLGWHTGLQEISSKDCVYHYFLHPGTSGEMNASIALTYVPDFGGVCPHC